MFKTKLNLNILFLSSHSYHIEESVNLNMQGTNSFDRTNYVCKNKTADYHMAHPRALNAIRLQVCLIQSSYAMVYLCRAHRRPRKSGILCFYMCLQQMTLKSLPKMNKSKICVSAILHRREESGTTTRNCRTHILSLFAE